MRSNTLLDKHCSNEKDWTVRRLTADYILARSSLQIIFPHMHEINDEAITCCSLTLWFAHCSAMISRRMRSHPSWVAKCCQCSRGIFPTSMAHCAYYDLHFSLILLFSYVFRVFLRYAFGILFWTYWSCMIGWYGVVVVTTSYTQQTLSLMYLGTVAKNRF